MNYIISNFKSSQIFIILSFLLLSSKALPVQPHISNPNPCLDNVWAYPCSDQCRCDLSEDSGFLTIYVSEGIIFFVNVAFLFNYFQKRKLRQRPNSFIFMMAFLSICYSFIMIMEGAIISSKGDFNESSCRFVGFIAGMLSILIELYVIIFFIYSLMNVRFTPEKKSSSTKPYHVLVWLLNFFVVSEIQVSGGFGRSVYGLCCFRSTLLYIVPFARYGLFTLINVIIALLIRSTVKSAHRISKDKKVLLRTYFPYAYYSIIIFIFEGVNDFILVFSTIYYGTGELSKYNENIQRIQVTSLAKNICKSLTPLVFIIACWRGRYSNPKKLKSNDDVSYSESLLDAGTSIDESYDVRISSSSSRIREADKVIRMLYAFFAGFHLSTYYYYENVGSINMTDAEYKKVIVSDNSVKQKAPHIYEEVKKQDKEFPASEFQSYGTKFFEELTKEKDIKQELDESFDFIQNHSHILRYSHQENENGEFFRTKDEKFVLKIVTEKDKNAFVSALPKYIDHLNDLPDSLLIRVYGVYKFKIIGTNDVYNLILMKRICDESESVLRHYELQGTNLNSRKKEAASSQGFAETPIDNIKVDGILKDTQFDRIEKKLQVFALSGKRLLDVLSKDVEFLSSVKLGGYAVAVYIIDSAYRPRDLALSIIQETTESNEYSQVSFFRKGDMELVSRNTSGEGQEQMIVLKKQGYFRFDSTTEGIYYKIGIVDYFHGDHKGSVLQPSKRNPIDNKVPIGSMAIAEKEYGDRLIKYFQIIVDGK